MQFGLGRSGLLESPGARLERTRFERVVDVLLALEALDLDAAGELGQELLDLVFEVVGEFATEFFGDTVSNGKCHDGEMGLRGGLLRRFGCPGSGRA